MARIAEQASILSAAAEFVKTGGYLCYITCSVLPQENEGQIAEFLDNAPEFSLISVGEVWEDLLGLSDLRPWSGDGCSVTLTPAATDTDGFFLAVLERNS